MKRHKRIWLQDNGPNEDRTWCATRQNDDDVEYILAPEKRYARITVRNPSEHPVTIEICGELETLEPGESTDLCLAEKDTGPWCDKCGAEITTGQMAFFCPKREECDFWVPEMDEFRREHGR